MKKNEVLYLGMIAGRKQYATVWSGMLLLKRNYMPYPLCPKVKEHYVVAGRFWKEVPHAFVKNPLNMMLYEDTLLSAGSWPVRKLLQWALTRDK